MRILLVEDEPRLASFILKGLRAEGYAVEHATSGADALMAARRNELALIILDLGLPDLDGTVVLRELRRSGNSTPVIVLTARGEVGDRVESLDFGADDYVVKPVRFVELAARVRARLRRDGVPDARTLLAGGVELDLRTRRVMVDGAATDLTDREFTLLETFMRHPGQVLSRAQLLSIAWGYEFDPGTNVVDVYVRYLRGKLGYERFETIRGVGYRFAP